MHGIQVIINTVNDPGAERASTIEEAIGLLTGEDLFGNSADRVVVFLDEFTDIDFEAIEKDIPKGKVLIISLAALDKRSKAGKFLAKRVVEDNTPKKTYDTLAQDIALGKAHYNLIFSRPDYVGQLIQLKSALNTTIYCRAGMGDLVTPFLRKIYSKSKLENVGELYLEVCRELDKVNL